jgi:hypothetical protein
VPDSLLILAPPLVLAIVFLLGFTGCSFEVAVLPLTLTFRAKVPTSLTVVSPPGVRFIWTRPGATLEEPVEVATSVQEGVDNVYEHEIPGVEGGVPEPGIWLGRCEMTVQVGNQTASDASAAFGFTLPSTPGEYVLSFATSGSPATPQDPFTVEADKFSQD